jgi:hypothetical protein
MKLKIMKAKLLQWKYWNNIEISMIKLMEDDWKYIKFMKLDEAINILLEKEITF